MKHIFQNKVNIIYSISETVFAVKPPKEKIAALQFQKVSTPVEDLMHTIQKGQSFTCSTFTNNHRDTDYFSSQQLLGVDFDNTLSLEQATEMLDECGLHYRFGYYTLSHTESNPRFRLLFILDGEIRDAALVQDINKALHYYFDKKTDNSCVDAARIWLGSTSKCFAGKLNKLNDFNFFIDRLNFKIYASDNNKTRNCIQVEDIISNICPKTGKTIIIYNNDSGISTKKNTNRLDEETQPLIEKWNLEDLLEYELFKRFYEGGASGKIDKLCHGELYGLATNLATIQGGKKLFKELLEKNKKYSKEKRSLFAYIVKKRYKPVYFRNFSPFDSDANHPFQTFPQALRKKGQVTVLQQPELITLADAEEKMKAAFENAISSSDNKVYLIKCATGLGKTEFIKNMSNVVVAFPNHQLLTEQYASSKLLQEEKLASPKLKGRFSKAIEQRFESLYAMELPKNVLIELKELASGVNTHGILSTKDMQAAIGYMHELEEVMNAGNSKTIFTTHKRAIQTGWLHETIIYDEDPYNVIMEQHVAKKSEVLQLLGVLMTRGLDVKNLTALLEQPDFQTPAPSPKFKLDENIIYEICVEQGFTSHVVNFFNSESYYVTNGFIHYCINQKERFSKNKKYIICDATASVSIYRAMFGERLEVIDISNVKNKGTINQYTSQSYSRTSMKKYVANITCDKSLPTITYKSFKDQFPNSPADIHFGGLRGTNILSGKDINVIGTYHYGDAYYKFLSHAIKITNEEWKMKYQDVEYNGRRFKFMTYSEPTLQQIHLETVEGELIQAVHRSRLLRYECTVNLHSNFPLAQATYFY